MKQSKDDKPVNKKDEAEEKPKKPREKKTVEYEGSRWAAVVLLVLTILAGWLFSVAR